MVLNEVLVSWPAMGQVRNLAAWLPGNCFAAPRTISAASRADISPESGNPLVEMGVDLCAPTTFEAAPCGKLAIGKNNDQSNVARCRRVILVLMHSCWPLVALMAPVNGYVISKLRKLKPA